MVGNIGRGKLSFLMGNVDWQRFTFELFRNVFHSAYQFGKKMVDRILSDV